ncbi:MAG: fibronectin type III domain-containing protein, partial [Acidobacteriaceae bacterium]|nr:fibronectin type III domain-containing protein [Acidobacteriaceae bacterium]
MLLLALAVVASFVMAGCGENNKYGNGTMTMPTPPPGGAQNPIGPGSAPLPSSSGYNVAYLGIPQYTCVRDWYVDPNGSDSNDGTTPATAFATINKADSDNKIQPGDCVNLAPGMYHLNDSVYLTMGGNDNSPTGYVVYRSTVPQQAHLIMDTKIGTTPFAVASMVVVKDYMIFDGIEFDGNNDNVTGSCVQSPGAQHHIVVENNIIHGCGSGGTGVTGDYHWYINNVVYDNAHSDYYYEGSGIDIYYAGSVTGWIPGFQPNDADLYMTNVVKAHMIIAFNTVYDNYIASTGCPANGCGTNGGTTHTDGNGIILDDWNHTQGDNNVYTGGALVIGNIMYNNGGAGLEIYESTNVVAANNSAYNNYTDPEIGGANRGEIACGPCMNSTIINNATFSVVGSAPPLSYNSSFYYNSGSSGTVYTTNIGYPFPNGFPQLTSGNKFPTDPMFVKDGWFSLQAGSPALGAATAEPWLTSSTPNMGYWQGTPDGATALPAAPAGVGATSVSANEIDLAWTPVDGVTYSVFRSAISGFTPSPVNQIASGLTTGSYKDTTLEAATYYYYIVVAVNSMGQTAAPQVSAETSVPVPPGAPTGLTVQAVSGSGIVMMWTPVDAPGITYNVYRDTASGFTPSASNLVQSGISAASYFDSGLAPNTTYYYVVEAVNVAGSSDPSNEASDTTTAPTSTIPATSGPGAAATSYVDPASLGVPQYVCVRDWYVDATTGDDTADGTTPATAWLTLATADANALPGDCINLNGTISIAGQVVLAHGGNANSPTGYVAYRALTPGSATILGVGPSGVNTDLIDLTTNYIILDGLTIDADNANSGGNYANCVADNAGFQHHIVVENSTVKNCGFGGINFNAADYSWAVNNLVENTGTNPAGNSIANFGALVFFEPTGLGSAFTPTVADQAFPYHNVAAYNIVHDNEENGYLNVEGNPVIFAGILINDTDHVVGWPGGAAYTEASLVVGNIVYNNSGSGISLAHDQNVTVVNNSTYGNNTQPLTAVNETLAWGTVNPGSATARGEITCDPCSNSTIINNATYAVVGSGDQTANNSSYYMNSLSGNNTFTTNIGYPSFGTVVGVDGGTGVDPTTMGSGNKLNTDPKFTAASTGDLSLVTGSPAIGTGTAVPWVLATPVNMGWWQSGSIPVPQVPSAPTGLTAAGVSATEIDLSWTAVSGAGITYSVYRDTVSPVVPSAATQIASGLGTSSYTDSTGLVDSTTYYYVVEAVNNVGPSGPSN